MEHTEKIQCAPEEPDDLRRQLVELNLTAAAGKLEDLLREAEEGARSYSDFLAALLRAETRGRFERKLARGLAASRLGPAKSLDEFDFSLRPRLSAPAVKELAECRWIQEGRAVICVGRPGTGKSHVAKALAHAACMKGYSVFYAAAAEMLGDLHASLADNTWHRTFRKYVRVDLLVCEELGYLPLDRHKADHLFRLVSARHPTRSMLVTANTGFKNWENFFPSKAQAIATIDRLIDRATILRFTGKSFRKPKDIYGDSLEGEE